MLEYPNVNEIYYPSSDDEPMGENDAICWLMTTSLDMLSRHFSSQDDIYVSSNSFVYYVEGDVKQRVAPDLYVVKGVPSKQRPNYKIWEEGVVPQVVFEYTTASSRYRDLGTKKGLYEALGVKEYYLFDPATEYLDPSFRAFHLNEGILRELPQRTSHFSPELRLLIRPEGKLLRFYEEDSTQAIPTSEELATLAEELGARTQALGVEAQELGARNQELGAKNQELGAKNQELGAKNQELGARNQELETELEALKAELERLKASDTE